MREVICLVMIFALAACDNAPSLVSSQGALSPWETAEDRDPLTDVEALSATRTVRSGPFDVDVMAQCVKGGNQPATLDFVFTSEGEFAELHYGNIVDPRSRDGLMANYKRRIGANPVLDRGTIIEYSNHISEALTVPDPEELARLNEQTGGFGGLTALVDGGPQKKVYFNRGDLIVYRFYAINGEVTVELPSEDSGFADVLEMCGHFQTQQPSAEPPVAGVSSDPSGPSAAATPEHLTAEQLDLIDEYGLANGICRGTSPPTNASWEACAHRQAVGEQLYILGACFGEQSQAMYEMRWHTCGQNSNRPKGNTYDHRQRKTSPVSPSFDCALASTHVEATICENEYLAALDTHMAKLFEVALVERGDQERFRSEQRTWLRNERNTCADVRCLERTYRSRIYELQPN